MTETVDTTDPDTPQPDPDALSFYDRPDFHPLHDEEVVDEVHIETRPRYKTSGLSGDEWRIMVHADFYHSGILIGAYYNHTMADVSRALPWILCNFWQSEHIGVEYTMTGYEFNKLNEQRCFQPGCSEMATVLYRLIQRFEARTGRHSVKMHEDSRENPLVRVFCVRHSRRGDSTLDDMDSNYDVVVGPPAEDAVVRSEDESPAGFAGFIEWNPEDGEDAFGDAIGRKMKEIRDDIA